jgi:hypothetical protein
MKSPRYSKIALAAALKYCAAAVVVCAVLVGFMNTRRAAAERRNVLAAQLIQDARARLDRANEHRALIETYRDPYDRLVREGLVERFDRAAAGDWFEAAIRARGAGTVDGYVIGKDTPYSGAESAELTAFRIVSHPLEFSAKVLDEDEFVALLTSIETQVPGTTAEEACSLTRNREPGEVAPLTARCALIWYEFAPTTIGLTANAAGT